MVLFGSGVVFFLWFWDEGGLERGCWRCGYIHEWNVLVFVVFMCFWEDCCGASHALWGGWRVGGRRRYINIVVENEWKDNILM